MIVVYPMLVSRAVSDKAVPVIAKALELYLIVHKQDEILRRANALAGGVSEQHRPYQPGNKSKDSDKQLTTPTARKIPRTPTKDYIDVDYEEIKSTDKDAKKTKVEISSRDLRTLSLEPTFITVKGVFGDRLVGVKVVPTRVRSDVKLSNLIAYDISLRWLNAKLVKLGRSVLQRVYQVSSKWKDETISGVPR
ncbi:MAG: hypothetical protein DRP42_07330, partial [Tenericutes bacterium]